MGAMGWVRWGEIVNGCGDQVDQLIVVGLTAFGQALWQGQCALESVVSLRLRQHAPLAAADDAFRDHLDFLALNLLPICPLLLRPRHPDPPSQEHLAEDSDGADLPLRLMACRDMDSKTQRRNDRIVVHVARLRVDDHRHLIQVDRDGASFSSAASNELSGTHRRRCRGPARSKGIGLRRGYDG